MKATVVIEVPDDLNITASSWLGFQALVIQTEGEVRAYAPIRERQVKPPTEVGRVKVSEQEEAEVIEAMAAFNRAFGTSMSPFSGRVFGMLVMRVRQARARGIRVDHDRLCQAVADGDHWWSGPPHPKLIYGNPDQFERSLRRVGMLGNVRSLETKRQRTIDAARSWALS